MILVNTKFIGPEWGVYLQGKLPMAWINLCMAFAPVFVIEWMTPGNTLGTILDVNEESSDMRVLCATLLMGMFAYVAVLAVTGRT